MKVYRGNNRKQESTNAPCLSNKQKMILAFGNSDYDALICDGAIRAGKTVAMTVGFISWALEKFNGVNFAICGKTVTSCYKNVILPFLRLSWAQKRFKLNYNRAEHRLTVRRGTHENTFYVYGGGDAASFSLIQGITLGGVLFDELTLLHRTFVEQAMSRCSIEGSKFWFNMNPAGSQHWFYREWILHLKEHNAVRLHFNLEDNPSLSDKKIKQYKSQYTGHFYDQYILGLWVNASGLVYSIFDESKYVCDCSSLISQSGQPSQFTRQTPASTSRLYYISIDYGITNPFVALLWCVENGVSYCLKEYYYSHKEHNGLKRTDEEHYEAVEKLAEGFNIDCIIIDPSANSFRETIRRHDRFEVHNANNEVIAGISYTTTVLSRDKIKIDKNCTHVIEEFNLYVWDEDASFEAVVKEDDHCMDALRYFIYTVYRHDYGYYIETESIKDLGLYNEEE